MRHSTACNVIADDTEDPGKSFKILERILMKTLTTKYPSTIIYNRTANQKILQGFKLYEMIKFCGTDCNVFKCHTPSFS